LKKLISKKFNRENQSGKTMIRALARKASLSNTTLTRHSSSFINSTSSSYLDAMYSAWKVDKSSVHISWQLYFENPVHTTFQAPPTLMPSSLTMGQGFLPKDSQGEPGVSGQAPEEIKDHMKVLF
jgi:2-oxoglutarate dehydrogenase complex dehydrogenase (E1) component-like enzyme